jgi:hypothetical protein
MIGGYVDGIRVYSRTGKIANAIGLKKGRRIEINTVQRIGFFLGELSIPGYRNLQQYYSLLALVGQTRSL